MVLPLGKRLDALVPCGRDPGPPGAAGLWVAPPRSRDHPSQRLEVGDHSKATRDPEQGDLGPLGPCQQAAPPPLGWRPLPLATGSFPPPPPRSRPVCIPPPPRKRAGLEAESQLCPDVATPPRFRRNDTPGAQGRRGTAASPFLWIWFIPCSSQPLTVAEGEGGGGGSPREPLPTPLPDPARDPSCRRGRGPFVLVEAATRSPERPGSPHPSLGSGSPLPPHALLAHR